MKLGIKNSKSIIQICLKAKLQHQIYKILCKNREHITQKSNERFVMQKRECEVNKAGNESTSHNNKKRCHNYSQESK